VEPVNLIFLCHESVANLENILCLVVVPVGSGLPSLADNEVTSVGELNGVTVVGGREVDVAAGLVVLVVVLATSEAVGAKVEVGGVSYSDGVGSRCSEGANCGREGKNDGGECNHFEDVEDKDLTRDLVKRRCDV
jgi:hypothetical protein